MLRVSNVFFGKALSVRPAGRAKKTEHQKNSRWFTKYY